VLVSVAGAAVRVRRAVGGVVPELRHEDLSSRGPQWKDQRMIVQWKTDGDRARVELFTIMPTDRLLELFNGAAHE
jgi:hypothetical protein